MKPLNIHEAKTHFSRIVDRAESGETIVIAKAGRPVAKLVPLAPARKPVRLGGLRLKGRIPGDFDSMFEKEIEAMFGGKPSEERKSARKKTR